VEVWPRKCSCRWG